MLYREKLCCDIYADNNLTSQHNFFWFFNFSFYFQHECIEVIQEKENRMRN